MMGEPNRWLRLRHRDDFDEERFAAFEAHCRVWKAYAQAILDNWADLPLMHDPPSPEYKFFEPTRSDDGRVVSLPLGGRSTLGSRSTLENEASRLLWQHFTIDFLLDLEEGITEDTGEGMHTSWRRVLRPA